MQVTVAGGTLRGLVRSTDHGPVAEWRGIPYAAPPVGRLRFRSPQPARPWSGVRPADRPGRSAAQLPSITSPRGVLGEIGEDCLYLDVAAAPAAPGSLRPVLVWVHGGAFCSGSAAMYPGSTLAAAGDVVVVSLNYRLGVFGFVDLSAIDPLVPCNLGLRDQVAALAWVRDNIAAFGGDPARVTLAGESAGSASVALLTCAGGSAGLFRSVIMQSGSYSLAHGERTKRTVADAYARILDLRPGDVERLHRLPTARLLAAQAEVGRLVRGTVPAAPWFDGDLLPESAAAAQAAVRPDLALLAGCTQDEVTLFQLLPGDVMPTSRTALAARLRSALGDEGAAPILAHYPPDRRGTRALGTDVNFAGPTRHFAARHSAAGGRTYLYRLDAPVPLLGTTHGAELPHLWNWSGPGAAALAGPPTRGRRRLGQRLRSHWLSFVRDQAPGPDWRPYRAPTRLTQIFSPGGDRLLADPAAAEESVWQGRDVPSRD